MDDRSLIEHISHLVDDEHRLRNELRDGKITAEEEHARLREIEVQLDQLWDLLRRRRAARRMGLSPDEVAERPADEVERYMQ